MIAFPSLQAKPTKCKLTHAKQIHAFQDYFQVVYRPNDLRRTISEAAVELKEKVTSKIPKLKIPGYAKDEYLYALCFGNIKFPPFPSSPLALAFGPPIPDWWVTSLSDIQNSYKKNSDRVVPTKHYLPDYSGHLHYGLQNFRVLSTTQIGNTSWKAHPPRFFRS